MSLTFNNRIKQILLLAILIALIWVVFKQLFIILPGLLGAVTLYILSRASNFQLVYNRKWKRGRAAGLFVVYYLLLLGLPVFLAVTLISPKLDAVLSDPSSLMENIKTGVTHMQDKLGVTFLTEDSLNNSLQKITELLPGLLNSTANLLTNLIIMLFFLYYMLYHSREMEKTLFRIIPLKDANVNILAAETKKIVKANALGIPLISIIQGITATIGYIIFGVQDWALWGFLTGVFAFFPVVGTMIVWVPLVLYTFAAGHTGMGIGLLLYSVIVTGNVDYIARITIMRRLGDTHPVMTVLGVIVGLGLFGFIGLIFGPLLVSYIIVLFRIYMNEFVEPVEEATRDSEKITEKE